MAHYVKIHLHGGNTYIQPEDELLVLQDEVCEAEVGEKWTLEKVEMDEDEYTNLPEFTGH